MKTVFLIVSMFLAMNSFSQKNDTRVLLSKGQKFTLHITSSQQVDMGMGMEMKNNTSSHNNFFVIDADDKSYIVSSTLTGLKIAMEVMGEQTTFDSDLKEDSASELGKSIKNLNIPDTVSVNKYTAEVSTDKKEPPVSKDAASNPMEGLFESLGDQRADMSLSDAFLVIPAGKKIGDSWTDSSSTKDQKTIKTYSIQSIEKNIATIIVIGNIVSSIQTEANGMSLTVTMTTKTNTEVTTDVKTSLVTKRSTKADITGNLEMMGQSLPISGKSTTTSVYEY